MGDRPAIPAELERALMLEAGWRCAVPTCRTVQPLEIEHIDDFAHVRRHEFHNMIVLCANCHRLKGSGPRSLDRKALRQLKANLNRLNHRYNEIERRIIEYFLEHGDDQEVSLPGSEVLYSYLVKDEIIEKSKDSAGSVTVYTKEGGDPFYISAGFHLTEKGKLLVAQYGENKPIE